MQVSITEAKARFAELVEAALRGEEVVITRRGKPAARMVPIGRSSSRIEDMRAEFMAALDESVAKYDEEEK